MLLNGPVVKDGFKNMEERRALPSIEYSDEDDRVIEDWIRNNVNTTWHSLGTCKMAPKEKRGVVDKELNVYGTKGLKLAGKLNLSSTLKEGGWVLIFDIRSVYHTW